MYEESHNTNDADIETDYNEDNKIDALAAIAIVLLPVISIVYWLSGMPTS